MARSMRFYEQGVRGLLRRNFNWAPINAKSTVIITAAEWHPQGAAGSLSGAQTGRYFLGDAKVWVSNIGPHGDEHEAGGVEYYVHVDSAALVNIVTTITVLEPYESFFS
jgi:hypothetical protein